MSDEPAGLTRRTAIQRGAVAAGIVWTTPILRTVPLQSATGTPPPSSTTTGTTPPITHYEFAGDVQGRRLEFISQEPPDVFVVVMRFTAEVSTLGAVSGVLTLRVAGGPPRFTGTAEGTLTTAEGTLSVTGLVRVQITGSMQEVLENIRLALAINNGAGAYVGATGNAVYDDRFTPLPFDPNFPEERFEFSGELSGSFDVPS